MKYIVSVIATAVLGWPWLVLGYLFSTIKSGFEVGMFLHDLHERQAVDKFNKKEKQ